MLLEPVENIMTSSGVSSSLMSSSVVSSVALGVGPMAGVDAMKVSMAPCAAVSRGGTGVADGTGGPHAAGGTDDGVSWSDRSAGTG